MRHQAVGLFAFILLLVSYGCGGGASCAHPDTGMTPASADPSQVIGGATPLTGLPVDLQESIQVFYRAIETDDHELRIALFSDDALMLPNHGERIVGKEAIAEVIRGGAGWVFRLRDRIVLDADADGGVAYTVNAYDYTYHPVGQEPIWHPTKNVHIWKRNLQGDWKLHVDLWNAD